MPTKAFVFALLLICAGLKSEAQANEDDKFMINIGPSIGWAVGTFKETHGFGWNGQLEVDVVVQEKLRLTAEFLSMDFKGKKYKNAYNHDAQYQDFDPLRFTAGAKYFYYRGLYAQAKAGYFTDVAPGGHGGGFAWSPVLGFEFGEGPYYTIAVHYDGYTLHGQNIGNIAFSLYYQF